MLSLSLLNDTFSNLKLIVVTIIGFVCSNKQVKQVLWINYSWISSTLKRGWGLEFCLSSKKKEARGVSFSSKKERLERVTYGYWLSLCL